MEPFCIPWPCLDLSPKPPFPEINPTITENKQPKILKSFAQAVTNVCEIPLSQFPPACVKGDRLSIGIPEEDYMAGIEACKYNLHGRIIWPKGATPLTVAALKSKLTPLWKDLSKWGVSSLGKGYYEFVFSTLEDVRRVRSIASWNLNPGILKLFSLTKDFNPRSQQNVSAQVWVRFNGLSQEYWQPNILFAIAGSIGTPICIDSITAKPMMERTFGQFVRVLVDMDLSQTLRYQVLVERKGFAFFVDIDYENLPLFCSNCKIIGHHVGVCKKMNLVADEKNDNENREKIKSIKEVNKVFVQTKDGRTEQRKVKEVINVESDKMDQAVTSIGSEPVEVNSKKIDGNNNMRASSSSKIDGINSQNSKKTLSQQNMFAVLVDNIDEVLGNSNQQISHRISSSQSKGKGIDSVLEPAEIFKEQDRSLEEELNNGIEFETEIGEVHDSDVQTSSTKGSFVDATQFQQDTDTNSEGNILITTPERVKKDMEFLKESWANMADNDEVEARLMEYLEKDPPLAVDNSQGKLSKGQKKAQKKQNQSSKDSYATRSRVNPEPFK
jgi:hypothetical protein